MNLGYLIGYKFSRARVAAALSVFVSSVLGSAVFFSFLLVSLAFFSFTSPVRAQESGEESETLREPASAPSNVGVYEGVNDIPESFRRSAPFARALDEMKRRAGLEGTFDVEQRVRAFEKSQSDLMRGAAAEKTIGGAPKPLTDAWTNIGLKGTANNNIYSAGCIAALAIDPSNPNIVYAGATSGGVWKTTDAGAHWAQLTDLVIPNLSVSSISIDPTHTNTIYVGTGNGYASVDELTGTGLYRSNDGGGTWLRIGAPTITGTVIKVLVHPTKGNIVFASLYSGNRGVYRSTDSGATWTKVFAASAVVWDIVPGSVINGTTLFYFSEGANIGASNAECGVYKSVNEGAAWSKISAAALPTGTRIGRSVMAVATRNPSRVFTLMTNLSGDTLGLYRSTDNGGTWTALDVPGTLFRPNSANPGQGWYDIYLGVTPNSSSGHDTLYVGGVEAYMNYTDADGWVPYSGYMDLPAQNPHVDHHSIAINPLDPSIVYVGCDGGVYWTQDAGQDWSYRSNQMVTNRFYHIGMDPNDSKTTMAGAQDQGTWNIVTGTGGTTTLRFGGDGFQPIISPQGSQIQFAELPNGTVYKTVNSGQNWAEIGAADFDDQTDWDTPFRMSIAPYGSTPAYSVLYLGRQKLWRTINTGQNFTAISPIFNNGPIQSIGLSQGDSRNIYVGLHSGIQLTTDGGANWASKSTGIPSRTVTSIVTTNRDTNFVLASFYSTTEARVMMSTNKGSAWTNVSGSGSTALPQVGVNCVALDSISPKTTWYAATDNGIYYTMDAGAHWSIAGSGIGLAVCRDVQLHKNKTTLRVATFGRGLWEANTNTLPVELSSLTYEKTQSGTRLLWHTDSERGNSGFEVERSVDGDAFASIGFLPGAGTSNSRHDYTLFDTTHSSGTYLYQLKQIDLDGSEHYSNRVEVHYGASQIIVYQNYPNPFLLGTPVFDQSNFGGSLEGVAPALATRFRYELPDRDVVSINIYSSTGVRVRTVLDQVSQEAGEQDAFWDGQDDHGNSVSSGAYFYVIETGHYGQFVNKMMLIHN